MNVAFDFDGTLVDTMPALGEAAVQLIARKYGVTEDQAFDLYWSTVGLSFHEQLDELFTNDARNEAAAAQFLKAHITVYSKAQPWWNAKDALLALHDKGHSLHVITSSPGQLVFTMCQYHFASVPLTVYGRERGTKTFQLTQSRAEIFVGDAPRDMTIANELGVQFIAVVNTFDEEFFPGARIAQSLHEVAALLDE